MTLTATPPRAEATAGPRRARPLLWAFVVVAAVAGGLVAFARYKGLSASEVRAAVVHFKGLQSIKAGVFGKTKALPHEREGAAAAPKAVASEPWDGCVKLNAEDEQGVGFSFAVVQAQVEPIKLELNGRTAYDPNTLTRIRPRFDTRVERVFAELGQRIKKEDPLVELYSTDLATAKSDFQTKYVQWQHDLKLYNLRQNLVQTGAISQQLWVDTQNDEQKSRLDFTLAHDKLAVFYEVPKKEIDPLVEHLSDKATDPRGFGNISDKAKMTLRSKTDGVVIEREVVPGNYYETTQVLMVIGPLDHLWVLLNVYEQDQAKVGVGQTLEIQFPFLPQKITGKVDYVANEVSKDTRAVTVRASIPNPDGKLKADMLLKAMLDIPPVAGSTVVPRLAMVAINGNDYVYVRMPKASKAAGKAELDRFVRRKVVVAQENTDHVVIADGLKPGEEVVVNGSLILSQLYEDQRVLEKGVPAE